MEYVEDLDAEELKGAKIYLDMPSVGATINTMLVAVKAKGKTIIENAAKEPEIVNVATFLNTMGAKIKGAGTNVITITGLPKTKNADHIRKIIEKEILLDKIDLRDESAEQIKFVIEKVPHKQCDMKEIFKRLYTKLQSSETYNMAFFDEEKIYVPCSFHKVVKSNLQFLIDTHQNRITKQLEQLKIKLRVLEVIEEMKKGNALKTLFDCELSGAIAFIVEKYKVSSDIANKVLQKPMSYLTREHGQEIIDLQNEIKDLETDQSDIYEFLTKKYKAIKKEINAVIKNKFAPTTFVKAGK